MRPPGTLSLLWHWRGAALRFLGVTAAVGVGLFAVTLALDAPMAPWMRSFGLWPTLTGQWRGTMVGDTGAESPVYFDLRGEVRHGRGAIRGAVIRGSARWCDTEGRIRDYPISGDTDNWRGTRFHLSLTRTVAGDERVWPEVLHGEWNGDEIRAAGTRPSVRLTLRRGGEAEFAAGCGPNVPMSRPRQSR